MDTSPAPAAVEVIRQRLNPSLVTRGRVVIIGLGGVGLWLTRALIVFLSGLRQALPEDQDVNILLCDGDVFGLENLYRMDIPEMGNKAEVMGRELLARLDCPGFYIRWVSEYAAAENISQIVKEGDLVLLACDNHATRNLVARRCASGDLRDVVLVSGGNDGVEEGIRGTYGNVQVYVRRDHCDVTAPLYLFHPEIAQPADQSPDQQSCLQLAATGAAQLVFANLAVANAMAAAVLRLLMPPGDQPMYDEVAFDILDAEMTPHWLTPQPPHGPL